VAARHRRLFLALATCAGCYLTALGAGLGIGGSVPALDGFLYDAGLAARAKFDPAPPADDSPVVVIAVDLRSLDSPRLRRFPRTFFGPIWGELIDGLTAAGAKSVAFDFLFAYGANEFKEGFDRPFLTTLSRNRGKVVLARSPTTLPVRSYHAALGIDAGALGLLDIESDPDGIYRRVRPYQITDKGETLSGLSNSALRQAGAPAMPDEVLLAPTRKLEALPTYAIVDVLDCGAKAPAALEKLFRDKIVFVGTTLADEDRKMATDRFLAPAPPDGPPLDPCGILRLGASSPTSASIPGVYLHAAAAAAVLRGRITWTVPAPLVAVVAGFGAAGGAAIGLALSPWFAVLAVAMLGLALWGLSSALVSALIYVPVGWVLIALLGSVVVAYVVRYLVEDRRRQRVQRAFSHYLSPSVVDQLAESSEHLRLGGERRDVTIMFADLSGFTTLSEKLSPEELVRETNRYLGLIVAEIEATGGYVDKFIGDAVMAIWGAPVEDADHAFHAVTATMRIAQRIAVAGREAAAQGGHALTVKIGMNSGPAVVGNVGTERRFNYTAVGDTVNLASRLEGIIAVYNCGLVIGEATRERIGDRVLVCEVDRITVKGKTKPVAIFEPLNPAAEATPEQVEYARRYAAALAAYRQRRFAEARDIWNALARPAGIAASGNTKGTPPHVLMAERAQEFVEAPPPDDWQGEQIFKTK
jgi:class 3 adenylate cyclase